MDVVVTGASGFIGSRVCAKLLRNGHQVRALDVASASDDVIQADVRDPEGLERALDGVENCPAVHLAGVLGTAVLFDNPFHAVDVNVNGTLRLLEAAARRSLRVVYFGNTRRDRLNAYAITKTAGAEFVLADVVERGAEHTLLRTTHAYGPGQHIDEVNKVVPTLVGRALLGLPLPLFWGGGQEANLIYVDDVAEALSRAAVQNTLAGRDVELGARQNILVRELAQLILDLTASKSDLLELGEREGQRSFAMEPMEYSPDDVMRAVGYWDLTPLEQGMRQTIDWYAANMTDQQQAYLTQMQPR